MTSGGRHAAEDPAADEELPARSSRSARRVWWIAAAAAAGLVVLGLLLLWWTEPSDDLEVVGIHGVEYTTNMPIDEHGGYVYVYIPVNADPGEVVLEMEDEADNEMIREFLDGLDTLVPGEHVVALSDSNLHFIVDGIEGEGDGS